MQQMIKSDVNFELSTSVWRKKNKKNNQGAASEV